MGTAPSTSSLSEHPLLLLWSGETKYDADTHVEFYTKLIESLPTDLLCENFSSLEQQLLPISDRLLMNNPTTQNILSLGRYLAASLYALSEDHTRRSRPSRTSQSSTTLTSFSPHASASSSSTSNTYPDASVNHIAPASSFSIHVESSSLENNEGELESSQDRSSSGAKHGSNLSFPVVGFTPSNSLRPSGGGSYLLTMLRSESILLILQCTMKRIIETRPYETWNSHFSDIDALGALLHSLVSFLSRVPVTLQTYNIVAACLNMLHLCCSTELFAPSFSESHLFLEVLMCIPEEDAQRLSGQLLICLSSDLHPEHFSERSLLSLLAQKLGTVAAAVIELPSKIIHRYLSKNRSSSERRLYYGNMALLSRKALNVLLLLLRYKPSDDESTIKNPYFSAFSSFAGGSIAQECWQDSWSHPTGAYIPPLSFTTLFEFCYSNVNDDRVLLLFYELILFNSHFEEFICSRPDLDVLFIPLINRIRLYSAAEASELYVVLVTLMKLSMSELFCKRMDSILLPSFQSVDGTVIFSGPVRLSSALIISVVEIIEANIKTFRDSYIAMNSLAILANISPFVSHLHLAASQKLIRLILVLSRRMLRFDREYANSCSSGFDVSNLSPSTPGAENSFPHADFLRIALETTYIALVPQKSEQTSSQSETAPSTGFPGFVGSSDRLSSVPLLLRSSSTIGSWSKKTPAVLFRSLTLLAELIRQREVILPLSQYAAVRDIASPLSKIIDHFFVLLTDENVRQGGIPWQTADQMESSLLSILSENPDAGSLPCMLPEKPSLRFAYEEESGSNDFFVPHLWRLIVRDPWSTLPWLTSNLYLSCVFDGIRTPLSKESSSSISSTLMHENDSASFLRSPSSSHSDSGPVSIDFDILKSPPSSLPIRPMSLDSVPFCMPISSGAVHIPETHVYSTSESYFLNEPSEDYV